MGRLVFLTIFFLSAVARAEESPRDIASRYYRQLAGVALPLDDPRRAEMEARISSGDRMGAARIAIETNEFINITVREFATYLVSGSRVNIPLNDSVATVMGFVRDWSAENDFRKILYSPLMYVGDTTRVANVGAYNPSNNNHYQDLDTRNANLADVLIPQSQSFAEPAGVITTRYLGQRYFEGGTNRRQVCEFFKDFLCREYITVADVSLSDASVRKDVDRGYQLNPTTGEPESMNEQQMSIYNNRCKSCHSSLDAIANSAAHVDFANGRMRHADDGLGGGLFTNRVANKMRKLLPGYNQNNATDQRRFDGFIPLDDGWTVPFAANPAIGWRTSSSGSGMADLYEGFANTKAFSQCMARKMMAVVCNGVPASKLDALAEHLGQKFEERGYNIKALAEEIALRKECIKQ